MSTIRLPPNTLKALTLPTSFALLIEEDQPLFAAVEEAPVLGSFEVEVPERKARKARTAKLEVRAVSVTLKGVWRPKGQRPDLAVNGVEAREI